MIAVPRSRIGRRFALFIAGVTWSCSTPSPTVPDFVDCSVFSPSWISRYVLPFEIGARYEVSRTFGHYTPANAGVGLYAVDFPMPIGTTVRAMRAGTVVAVEERFSNSDKEVFHENWVMIRHADDTVGRYIHLSPDGVWVDVGDVVAQGQAVGASGNSGPSFGPHLHVDVQTCGPNLPPGYNDLPCGMTVPLSFRNTTSEPCGLVPGRTYRAFGFRPE